MTDLIFYPAIGLAPFAGLSFFLIWDYKRVTRRDNERKS